MIAFFNPFDLFECPLIIPISCDGFQHGGGKSLGTIINVNPESMRIIVVFDNSPGGVVAVKDLGIHSL